MAEGLYSKRSRAQFRGPVLSENENERIDNAFKDLSFIYNRMGSAEERLVESQRQAHKDMSALEWAVSQLEQRVKDLEDNNLHFSMEKQDTVRFNNTEFHIEEGDRLTTSLRYGYVTLNPIIGSSESRIRFQDSQGEYYLPSIFNATTAGVLGSADDSNATINESNIYNAFLNVPGRVWERNVVVDAVDPDHALVSVYIGIPASIAPSLRANLIYIEPFPSRGVDIMSIGYTTSSDVNLNDTDAYTPLNDRELYIEEDAANGFVAPGVWDGDAILNAGPTAFYFDPKNITALRVVLRARNYYLENNKVIYTYGLADVDLRSEKYQSEGKAIFRLDAPSGQTISEVSDVTPHIYNVSPFEEQELFDYRVIWETAFDSEIYTTNPVPLSQRAWIEVTLRKTVNGGTPALSSIDVDYS